jgi:septal ring factor EnvC (AmiA/AmiB activator)
MVNESIENIYAAITAKFDEKDNLIAELQERVDSLEQEIYSQDREIASLRARLIQATATADHWRS